jgi:hypothetical protein
MENHLIFWDERLFFLLFLELFYTGFVLRELPMFFDVFLIEQVLEK